MRRQRGRVGLMAAALVGLMASGAAADVTTERSASIIVFPKVIADGTRDTIIQITNTSNSMVHAHCFYVNAAPVFPDLPPGPGNPPQWVEIDFDIRLTKQQPTHWVVSLGRLEDPTDARCSVNDTDCDGAGFDPGRVPPQVEDFVGELKCVEVDSSGAPLAGNHLKGEATIVAVDRCDNPIGGPTTGFCASDNSPCGENADCPGTTGDVAKYNALGVEGLETLNDDGILCLGGQPTAECPLGAEYNACPDTWILNHIVDSQDDPFIESDDPVLDNLEEDSRVDTSITVIPCTQDFEQQFPETAKIQILTFDEFESSFSASTSVTCWAELQLNEISNIFLPPPLGPLDRTFAQTRFRPSQGADTGFMIVSNSRHCLQDGSTTETCGTAAVNLFVEGERPGPDLIVIPADQLQ